MQERPTVESKQQNVRTGKFSTNASKEEVTRVLWVNGKWARSLVAALVLLLLLLAAAFYMPRSTSNSHYKEPASRAIHRANLEPCRIIQDCEVICEYINGEPGYVAVDFIKSNKSRCGDRPEVTYLEFNGCSFPNFKLSKGWLPLEKTVNQLKISNSTIYSIEDGAFSNLRFTGAGRRLTIVDFQVSWLSKDMFQGVQGLEALELRHNDFLVAVEEDFLAHLAPILKTIQIEQMDMINNQTIKNITAASTDLSKVVELVLQWNPQINYLDPDIFTTMRNLKSLHLAGNNLKSIHSQTFQSIRNSIALINIAGNSLTTLTEGTFEGMEMTLNRKYLKDNPWNCNCSLVWLQDMMRERNDTFFDEPLCRTPANLANVPLRYADMCENATEPPTTDTTPDSSTIEPSTTDTSTTETSTTGSSTSEPSTTDSSTSEPSTTDTSTTETSTTDNSTSEPSTTDSSTSEPSTTDSSTTEQVSTTTPVPITTDQPDTGTITVECTDLSQPKNLPLTRTVLLQERTHYQPATALNMPVKRRLMASMTFALVDFKVKEEDDGMVVAYLGNLTGTLIQIDSEDKINHTCFINATGSVFYKNLQPASSYTFCLHTEESQEVFTYNCRALTTLPVPKKRTWLLQEDQMTVLYIGLTVMLVCGVLGSGIAFVVVRRNPVLLKGSKRVVVVKQRAVDVMVLPKHKKHNATSSSSYRSNEQQVYSMDSSSQRTDSSSQRKDLSSQRTDSSSQRDRDYSHSISQTSVITGRSSSTSYVSAVEPTPRELMQWRIEQMRSKVRRLFNHENSRADLFADEPPPLPPYPLRRQSSTMYIHRESNVSNDSAFSA